MNKIILLTTVMLCAISMSFSQATWDNFENSRRGHYNFTNGIFVPYTENPDQVGNTSPVVAKYTRNAAEQFDVLVIDGVGLAEDLTDYVSNTKQMSIDVWSPAAGITVQITMEDSALAKPANFPTGRHSVYLATTTVDSAWETLTFSFDNQPDASVSSTNVGRLILLFNPNSNTGDTYYYDNLVGPAFAADPCEGVVASDSILNDFECNQNSNVTFNHGQSLRRIPNPDASGGNTSSYVASYIRNPGEENDVIVGTFPTPPVLGDTNGFKIMVWDGGAPTDVVLSLQKDGTEVVARTVTTSAASQWEELTFGFGDLSAAGINGYVILFDPGNFTSNTYYFDNFSYVVDNEFVGIEDYLNEGMIEVFPNPSRGKTQFSYELTNSGDVSLAIYDLAGRQVNTVSAGFQPVGRHQLTWEAADLPNGLYVYRFKVNDELISGKIMLSR